MENFTNDIEEITGGLTAAQKSALDKAHNLYHKKLNGPLPLATQIAIVCGVKQTAPKTTTRKKASS